MKNIKFASVLSLIIIACSSATQSHESLVNPEYQELNDCLMAIQILRINDPNAQKLFTDWRNLANDSWAIRMLTENQNLTPQSSAVIHQVEKTGAERKQLLNQCRAYFANRIQQEEGIKFTIGNSINITKRELQYQEPVHRRKVVVVEVQNKRNSTETVTMKSDNDDQILFWNSQFPVEPHTSRYTFLVLAPNWPGQSHNTIHLSNGPMHASSSVTLTGTTAHTAPFTLLPGVTEATVNLPPLEEKLLEGAPSFSSSIQFSITDSNSGEAIAARVVVTDGTGEKYWSPLRGPAYALTRPSWWGGRTPFWDYQPGSYFYLKGEVELGSTLEVRDSPTEFVVEAQARTPHGNIPVEIIFNGKVIKKTTDPSTRITLQDSGWIAVRTEGAHSNPVYIEFEGRPAGLAEPTRKFIVLIDRLINWVETKAIFENRKQKESVIDSLTQGRQVYQEIVNRIKNHATRKHESNRIEQK